jgi:hypothetical protein
MLVDDSDVSEISAAEKQPAIAEASLTGRQIRKEILYMIIVPICGDKPLVEDPKTGQFFSLDPMAQVAW